MTQDNKTSHRIVATSVLAVLLASSAALPASAGVFETIGKITGGPIKALARPMDKFYGGIADTAGRTAKKIFAPDPPKLDDRHRLNNISKKALDPDYSKNDRALQKNISDLSKMNPINLPKMTAADLEKVCEKQGKVFNVKDGVCIKYGGGQ